MGGFREHERFEERFEQWSEAELKTWRAYWMAHAKHIQPKIMKLAMKRIHRIDKRIAEIVAGSDPLV